MPPRRPTPFALLAAALAVLCQLVLGQPAQAGVGQGHAPAVHICAAMGTGSPERHGHHPAMDYGQCPLCAGLAAAGAVPPSPAPPPPKPPQRGRVVRDRAYASLAPPRIDAAPPRGPPVLS